MLSEGYEWLQVNDSLYALDAAACGRGPDSRVATIGFGGVRVGTHHPSSVRGSPIYAE